jgi:dihydroorotate dehydrogenase electron transfer subunit
MQVGETLNIVYPLGNGFTLPEKAVMSSEERAETPHHQRIILIGGGAGTAPLLYLGKQLHDLGYQPTFLLGGRTINHLLQLAEFEKYGEVHTTTEDGSHGEKGFVTNHSVLTSKYSQIYVCGPKPMMVAVAKYAKQHDIPCEVSLENKMACGIGACLCCVEKTTFGNSCVCTAGPVFNINHLTWQI